MTYILFIFLVFCSFPCYSYLDGGTSSLLLQLIFGGGTVAIVFLKMYLRKILIFFRIKK